MPFPNTTPIIVTKKSQLSAEPVMRFSSCWLPRITHRSNETSGLRNRHKKTETWICRIL